MSKKELEITNEDIELLKENEELKKQLHEASLTIQEMTEQDIECPSNCDKMRKLLKENEGLKRQLEEYKNQQKEFIKYLEEEKDRLARGVSSTYEDGLGKTRFVNEDIFNEIDKNLQKYKEIIGGIKE